MASRSRWPWPPPMSTRLPVLCWKGWVPNLVLWALFISSFPKKLTVSACWAFYHAGTIAGLFLLIPHRMKLIRFPWIGLKASIMSWSQHQSPWLEMKTLIADISLVLVTCMIWCKLSKPLVACNTLWEIQLVKYCSQFLKNCQTSESTKINNVSPACWMKISYLRMITGTTNWPRLTVVFEIGWETHRLDR